MKVRSLQVRGFRNIRNAQLLPSGSLNAFWGENAQGKTNLLEALYASLRGNSFRPYASRGDWIPKDDTEGSQVSVEIEDDRGYSMQVEALRAPQQSAWDFRIDGKRATAPALRSRLAVVVFSPDDHAIVRQGPDLRRDYLDDVLSDVCPGYVEVLERFQRALRSRNALLKKDPLRSHEIASWSEVLAEASSHIANLRAEMWPDFRRLFLELGSELFQGFEGELELSFEADIRSAPETAYSAAHFLDAYRASWEVDRATGWTHRGPQRDDFVVNLGNLDARHGFSQGQARLLALLLRWTHASWVARQRRATPIFLIDDFSSELDSRRRARLLELIQGLEGQIFLTGTDPRTVDLNPVSEYTHYNVLGGVFSPA